MDRPTEAKVASLLNLVRGELQTAFGAVDLRESPLSISPESCYHCMKMGEPRKPRGAEAPTIGEILASAPWKHALFTTYALSLSYFESEVLRPLIRGGCHDIWLIADAEGYRSSLLERRSARVGQEYRLIPAALRHGVFHSKCVYLAGDDGDLLIVGSGNVTFGGHGKNAEVFEALKPNSAAGAFEEFALFLESIGSRPDIQLARRDWVDDFAARARRAAQRGNDAESEGPAIRLVHSLEVPIIQQLPDLLQPFGPCADATIVSPYHDSDGSAVKQLLARIDAPRGAVAVPTGKKAAESPFPFAAAAAWDRPVTSVSMRKDESRFMHAKWYEFAQQDSLVLLTGSINATRKALTTTDNVELGVLRRIGRHERLTTWVRTAMPAFVPQSPMPSGLGNHEVVYASFDRTEPDRLRGQLITLQSGAGVWQARLVQADGETFSYEAHVDEDGRFTFRDVKLEAFSHLPAIQIVMSMGDRQALGWVHNDMLLGMSARRRLTAGALARLMRRDATDDDIQALLDYLSMHAEHHLCLFDSPVAGKERSTSDDGEEDRIVSVHIDELAPLAQRKDQSLLRPLAGAAPDDQFHMAMARLRRALLGHGKERRKAGDDGRETGLAEDDAEGRDGRTPEGTAEKLGLGDFERAISSMIDEATNRPEVRSGLLVMLLEISMNMRLHRLDDKDGAREFLNGWLVKACRLNRADPKGRSALQQHVVTAAATLYAVVARAGTHALLATELHDALETFYHGPVDRAHAAGSLIGDPETGFAAALIGETQGFDLAEALDDILATRTRRRQLDEALTLAEKSEPIPANWEVFQTKLGKRLWKALQHPQPQRTVKRSASGFGGCGFDYLAFPRQEAAQFERERIGFCVHCKRFTVNTRP